MFNKHTLDPIVKFPDHADEAGRAWRCDLAALRATLKAPDGSDAAIENWIVEAPWAHPVWHSYTITLCHLRPMADDRETVFYVEGATHEFVVHALDPDQKRAPVVAGAAVPAMLTPANFAAQIIAENDDAARARIKDAVMRICAGHLSPDTDHIRVWAALFGDAMLRDRPGAADGDAGETDGAALQ